MDWLRNVFSSVAGSGLSPEQAARLAAWKNIREPVLNKPHRQKRYVVVDIEASGLDYRNDRLISIGAVALNQGVIEMSDAFEVVLRQEKVSNKANILIHGIGASAQREGVEPAEAVLQFLEYVGKAPLVAYHAFFDQAMIDRTARECLGFRPEFTWHDLAWLLPEFFPARFTGVVGLDAWLEQFGITNFQRHQAVSDCLATAQLLQIALTRASASGCDTPLQLLLVEQARRSLRRS